MKLGTPMSLSFQALRDSEQKPKSGNVGPDTVPAARNSKTEVVSFRASGKLKKGLRPKVVPAMAGVANGNGGIYIEVPFIFF
jgi:hypothetical protein